MKKGDVKSFCLFVASSLAAFLGEDCCSLHRCVDLFSPATLIISTRAKIELFSARGISSPIFAFIQRLTGAKKDSRTNERANGVSVADVTHIRWSSLIYYLLQARSLHIVSINRRNGVAPPFFSDFLFAMSSIFKLNFFPVRCSVGINSFSRCIRCFPLCFFRATNTYFVFDYRRSSCPELL